MITYESPKNQRFKTTKFIKKNKFNEYKNSKRKYRVYISINVLEHWYFPHINKWVHRLSDEYDELRMKWGYSSADNPVDSIRAFRRYLKKHSYLSSGTRVTLVSRIIGNNVYGKIK